MSGPVLGVIPTFSLNLSATLCGKYFSSMLKVKELRIRMILESVNSIFQHFSLSCHFL